MAAPVYTLFFTGNDNPREDLIVIGTTNVPIFFRFETPPMGVIGDTRTMVYRNNSEVVASFNWILHVHLGTVRILGREFDMASLAVPNADFSGRRFTSGDGGVYEWRKQGDGYDLFALATHGRIAEFRRATLDTPVGEAHALLQLSFPTESLILEALLALAVVRWVDWQGWPYISEWGGG